MFAGSAGVNARPKPDASIAYLIENYDHRLRRYLSRSLKPEDVDDVLQGIYTRLARAAQQEAPPVWNATYVFKTADSVTADLFRRRRTRCASAHDEIPPDLPADQPSPFDELRWRQNAQLLRRAIDALPPREKQVLLQSRIEGLGLAEIARLNNAPLRTVQKQLSSALASCRDTLKANGWFDA